MRALTFVTIVSLVGAAVAAIWSSLEGVPHLDFYVHPHVDYPVTAWDLWQIIQPGIH
jgi:hypothetical protein